MTTTLNNQFLSQPDWWAGVEVGAGPGFAITETGEKDATITRDSAGVYDMELGSGGCDLGHREIRVDVDVNALWSVTDTDNTHKRFTFLDDTGAAIDPTRIMITVRRLAG